MLEREVGVGRDQHAHGEGGNRRVAKDDRPHWPIGLRDVEGEGEAGHLVVAARRRLLRGCGRGALQGGARVDGRCEVALAVVRGGATGRRSCKAREQREGAVAVLGPSANWRAMLRSLRRCTKPRCSTAPESRAGQNATSASLAWPMEAHTSPTTSSCHRARLAQPRRIAF